jgi:hypothetical protein
MITSPQLDCVTAPAETSFGNDMVTNAFDIDIIFCLVCCLYGMIVSTSNAVSAAINKGTMFFKARH